MECNVKNRQYLVIAAIILCMVNALALAMFPVASSVTAWKGYRVLSVSPSDREREMLDILAKRGIRDYVTESNSPVKNTNDLAPVQPFISVYIAERNRWFRDQESDIRFVYLDDTSFSDGRLLQALSDGGFSGRLEEGDGMLFFPLLILVALCAVGIAMVRNRAMLVVAALPFLAYSLSGNRVHGFFSAVIALSSVILLADILDPGRFLLSGRQIAARISGNPLVLVPVAGALAVSFADSLHLGLLFLSCLVLSVSCAFLYRELRSVVTGRLSRHRLHPKFKPLPMNPGTMYRKRFINKRLLITVASFAVLSLATGGVLFTVRVRKPASDSRVLSIPAPSGYTGVSGFPLEGYRELMSMKDGKELPDLGDYVAFKWKMTVFPWLSIHGEPASPVPGDVVEIQDFIAAENGVITPTARRIGKFDEAFVRDALHTDTTPLERMLLRQGRFATASYTRHDR